MAENGLFSRLTQAILTLSRGHKKKYGELEQFIGGAFHQDCTIEDYYDDDDGKFIENIVKEFFYHNADGAGRMLVMASELNEYIKEHKDISLLDFQKLGFDYVPDDKSPKEFLVLMRDILKNTAQEIQNKQ